MNPTSFGYKSKWLAIKCQSPGRVIELLSIHETKIAEWSDGIAAGYEGEVFVSPCVSGWVLVVTVALPDFGGARNADTLTPWIIGVSGKLNTVVQYFCTHRVVEYHAWCWAEQGMVLRAFAWSGASGETVANFGKRTKAEEDLGVRFFEERSPEALQDRDYWGRKDLSFPNEQYVMQLAGKWSVNPMLLEEDHPELGPGWLGRFC